MKTKVVICAGATALTAVGLGAWFLCVNGDLPMVTIAGKSVVSGVPAGVTQLLGDNRETADDAINALPVPESPAHSPRLPHPVLRELQTGLNAADREEDEERRAQLLEQTANRILLGKIADVVAYLNQQEPSDIVVDLRSRLFERWAESDPNAAANVALDVDGEHRQNAINTVMGVWTNRDLDDAIEWARALPDGDSRWNTLLAIGADAARTSPELGVELALEVPQSRASNELLAHAVAEWTTLSPEGARDWARTIDDEALRYQLVAAVASAMGAIEPAAAGTFALETLGSGRAQADVLTAIVEQWAQTDPAATAVWVARFPEGDLRDAATENLVKLWAEQDRSAAAAWINGLPVGSGRDVAVRAYAEQLAPFSYRTALTWAESIGDAEPREMEIENIVKLWITVDSAAANGWLNESHLPHAIKQRLLSKQP